MIARSAAIASLLASANGRGARDRVRGFAPRVSADDLRRKPVVSAPECGTAVERFKQGPVDIATAISEADTAAADGTTKKYFDLAFYGSEAIWNEGFNPQGEIDLYATDYANGEVYWKSWKEYFPNNSLFSFAADGSDPQWHSANQGGAGNCYFMASIAAAGEYPEILHDAFVTNEDNAAGIYGVRFFIRGKPWVVDVDDALVWDTNYAADGIPAGLVFSQPFDNNGDMWGTVLEKAWGKVKGSITTSGQGGFVGTGMRSLTGAPYFQYYPTADDVATVFELLQASDAAGYLMGGGTAGGGDDQETNACGIAMSHAYSLISAFTMTDADGTAHDVLMFRNPWGEAGYTGTWSKDDPNWTDALVAQVPFAVDVRTAQADDGIFIVPTSNIIGDAGCIEDVGVAHYRDAEGYTDDWTDAIDMDEGAHLYKFEVPAEATMTKDGLAVHWDSLYVTVESYYSEVVPMSCFAAAEGEPGHPVYEYRIDRGFDNYVWSGGEDMMHQPVQIMAYDETDNPTGYNAGDTFEITVGYTWNGSPAKDYTVKVYSKHSHTVQNYDDVNNPFSNQKFTDGENTPSEFTGNPWTAVDMQIGTDRPQCELTMSCEYDADEEADNGGGDSGNDEDLCVPTAYPGGETGYRITISGHPTAEFNGAYCGVGEESWNGQAPYRKPDGETLYYYGEFGVTCWQFTSVLDSEIHNEYEGGHVCSQYSLANIGVFITAEAEGGGWAGAMDIFLNDDYETPYNVAFVLEELTVDAVPEAEEPEPETYGCELVALDGLTYAPVLRVKYHHDDQYNGDYCHDGALWADYPHFVSASGLHMYLYNSAAWQLDDRDQDPEALVDYFNGGFLWMSGYTWHFYDFSDHALFYPLYWKDAEDADQVTKVQVQYFEEPVEIVEDPDAPECSPTHESGEVLVVSGHPWADYNGRYCRTEDDWNEKPHYESYTHMHFYYYFDSGFSCYMLDETPVGEAAGLSSGGSMCDQNLEYTIDLIFSDENYQYVWLGGWALLGWERVTEEPQAELGGIEVEECAPTHRSGEVLLIYAHPIGDYNGKYCRGDDWADAPHYEHLDGLQYYYLEVPDQGYSCYCFDDVAEAPSGGCNGGSMCSVEADWSVDVILADEALWQIVYGGYAYGPLYFEAHEEEGGSGGHNEDLQHESGAYKPARSVG